MIINAVTQPSTDKPGGGGTGGGGPLLSAANIMLQPKNPSNVNIILFGAILIFGKSKKKISLSKCFLFYFER